MTDDYDGHDELHLFTHGCISDIRIPHDQSYPNHVNTTKPQNHLISTPVRDDPQQEEAKQPNSSRYTTHCDHGERFLAALLPLNPAGFASKLEW